MIGKPFTVTRGTTRAPTGIVGILRHVDPNDYIDLNIGPHIVPMH